MKRFFSLFILLAVIVSTIVAQTTPTEVIDAVKNAESPTDLFSHTTVITALIMSFLGYLSPFIPVINKIPSTTYQVASVAIITIIGGIMFGFADVWQGAIAYLISTNLYTHIFKIFAKTPKSEASKK
jgi:hypothetical protein